MSEVNCPHNSRVNVLLCQADCLAHPLGTTYPLNNPTFLSVSISVVIGRGSLICRVNVLLCQAG